MDGVEIREYKPEDEQGWLRCRVLAFLDTAYYDNVLFQKERYENPAIELVAVVGDSVVGLVDVECEVSPGTVCYKRPGLGGMIWHLAVHPDWRRKGIGARLLDRAREMASERGIERFEAWTRDDLWVNNWYSSHGFEAVDSYLHVFIQGKDELEGVVKTEIPGLKPVQVFAHYVGNDWDCVRRRFSRVHQCNLYELRFQLAGEQPSGVSCNGCERH